MVDNQVHNDLDTKSVSLFDNMETTLVGAVARPNLFVVGDVIAHVLLGRVKEGTHPDGIDARLFEVF